jgi:hypothetical protein
MYTRIRSPGYCGITQRSGDILHQIIKVAYVLDVKGSRYVLPCSGMPTGTNGEEVLIPVSRCPLSSSRMYATSPRILFVDQRVDTQTLVARQTMH